MNQLAAVISASEASLPAEIAGPESQIALYKALGDKLRLRILRLLEQESFGVLELCRILEVRQPALSHHLKLLAQVDLLSTRREGNSVFYRRTLLREDHPMRGVLLAVFAALDAVPIDPRLQQRIEQIHLERAQQSRNFFHKHAAEFREQQGLIVAHDDYADTLHETIDSLDLANDAAVLEVGPGEGQLLSQLAGRFSDVTGLDNSEQMLDRSRQTLADHGQEQAALVLGETSLLRKRKKRFDLILFDMVLHHISSPAETMTDCFKLLQPGGHLLIADLSNHDQDWVRESCGDLWLGFELDDLRSWAEAAGLKPGACEFLGLRNGFQIQLCLFRSE